MSRVISGLPNHNAYETLFSQYRRQQLEKFPSVMNSSDPFYHLVRSREFGARLGDKIAAYQHIVRILAANGFQIDVIQPTQVNIRPTDFTTDMTDESPRAIHHVASSFHNNWTALAQFVGMIEKDE